MAISGSLKDVSAHDVMQFVQLGNRTGTLLLARGEERALLGFHLGKLVKAQAPRTPKMGDLLVGSGKVSAGVLRRAVEAQVAEGGRRTLGQILTEASALTAEDLRTVVASQLARAVSEVVTWDDGTFDFALDDLRPIDDIALTPSDVAPDAFLDTQMVLLEAARIFEERDRLEFEDDEVRVETGPRRALGPAATVTPPVTGQARTRLLLVSADQGFAVTLAMTLPPDSVEVIQVEPAEALGPASAAPPQLILVDLRVGDNLRELAELRAAHPGAALLALVAPGAALAPIFAAGAIATLPADPEAVAGYLESFSRNFPGARAAASASGGALPATPVERLRKVFGELRSGLISATVALNLMHLISESFERAVLFLVKRDMLSVLGAFGSAANDRPLAEVTRGLRLGLDRDHALARGWRQERMQNALFTDADLPEPFLSMLGAPCNGQVVVFPVLGAQRVIAIVYADNGDRPEAVENIDILELATAQVGIAFENELLRRQIGNQE